MVLLTAAITTKAGKPLISRQFVEMNRARIEGLLTAFPKLVSSGKQHTFVETESVRYVYQPIDNLYMVLITTRASNILEDLETLRLFSRVIPECTKSTEEADVLENAFNIIFAFDEIVALGYRESVNLAQIRTFVEMDSHEEKVYQAVRLTQEREAKQKMKEKARELQKARQEAKKGISSSSMMMGRGGSGGFGANFGGNFSNPVDDLSSSNIPKSSTFPAPSAPSSTVRPGAKSLKLGSKSKEWDTFADQLKQEGETIAPARPAAPAGGGAVPKSATAPSLPAIPQEPVHLRAEEKISATVNRDGGLQSMELSGLLTLRISDERFGFIKVLTRNDDDKGVQITQHPNIDKELFRQSGAIGLKVAGRPFPLNGDVGVLKWRYQTHDETMLPFSLNCWVSDNGSGGCDVNIEYELLHKYLQLQDVQVTIPVSSTPVVNDCEGDYHHDPRRSTLTWTISVMDADNTQGVMEFSCDGSPQQFYPLRVEFVSPTLYSQIKITDVVFVENNESVKFSQDTTLRADKYEIV